MGRNKIEIPIEKIIELCEYQCTKEEIASYMRVSPDTIERKIKREFNQTFGEFYKMHAPRKHVSLRRRMWQTAEREEDSAYTVNMQQYLDRKYLGGLPNEGHAAVSMTVVQPNINEKTTIELIKEALTLPSGEEKK